jgi:hypothetical protein
VLEGLAVLLELEAAQGNVVLQLCLQGQWDKHSTAAQHSAGQHAMAHGVM